MPAPGRWILEEAEVLARDRTGEVAAAMMFGAVPAVAFAVISSARGVVLKLFDS
jgi:hypothetical protein